MRKRSARRSRLAHEAGHQTLGMAIYFPDHFFARLSWTDGRGSTTALRYKQPILK